MLTLKIGDSGTTLSGIISLDVTGALDGIVSDSTLEIAATRQLSGDNWYSEFADNKLSSMEFGGSLSADNDLCELDISDSASISDSGFIYSFSGNNAYLTQNYLKTIQNTAPHDNGDISLLPSKTVDVTVYPAIGSPSTVRISLPRQHFRSNQQFYELYLLMWQMYQALCNICGRLQIFDSTVPRFGKPGITKFGYCLGTYLNYQAAVARWNFYSWYESFTLDIVESGERVSMVVGLTNLNCKTSGISYELTVTYTGTDEGSSSFIDPAPDYTQLEWDHVLTIFNQGVDTNITPSKAAVTTTFHRNGTVTGASGYEGKSPGNMSSASVETTVNQRTAGEFFDSQQFYRNIIAIAPCIGIDDEYIVQKGTPTVFHHLSVVATWTINSVTYTKNKTCKIAATGFYKEVEP